MGYPETGQVTEIVPPSTDFTEGMGRTRGGPARRREGRRMRWRLLLGSAKARTRATESGPRLRDSASWLPLSADASSRNLGPPFRPCLLGEGRNERGAEPAAIMKPHFAAEKFSNTAKLEMKG